MSFLIAVEAEIGNAWIDFARVGDRKVADDYFITFRFKYPTNTVWVFDNDKAETIQKYEAN